MRTALHIFTRPPDELVKRILNEQQVQPGLTVEIVDLTAASEPDYSALLERIMIADSVATW